MPRISLIRAFQATCSVPIRGIRGQNQTDYVGPALFGIRLVLRLRCESITLSTEFLERFLQMLLKEIDFLFGLRLLRNPADGLLELRPYVARA